MYSSLILGNLEAITVYLLSAGYSVCVSLTTSVLIRFQLQLAAHTYELSSFLGYTAQLRPWPPPQNPAEFLGGFSTISFFTG
jgi:hypothetical protein